MVEELGYGFVIETLYTYDEGCSTGLIPKQQEICDNILVAITQQFKTGNSVYTIQDLLLNLI